jgi:hypothetical protein
MPISVVCPVCSSKIKAPDRMAGRKAKCPKCGCFFIVNAADDKAPSPTPRPTMRVPAEQPHLPEWVPDADWHAPPPVRGQPAEPAEFAVEPVYDDAPEVGTVEPVEDDEYPPAVEEHRAARQSAKEPRPRSNVLLVTVIGAVGAAFVLGAIVLAVILLRGTGRKGDEAIEALSRIEAVTEAGVNLRKYTDLIADSAPDVKAKLAALPDGPVKTNLEEAWNDYKNAGLMWSAAPTISDTVTGIYWGRATRWLARARALQAGHEPPPPPRSPTELLRDSRKDRFTMPSFPR